MIFLICVGDETCDLLYNASDGLRGRYWQSPDHGFGATKYLIGKFLPALISFAKQTPPTRNGECVYPELLLRSGLDHLCERDTDTLMAFGGIVEGVPQDQAFDICPDRSLH